MRIIFQNADGGCSVVVPAPNSGLSLEQVISQAVPGGAAYKVVPVEAVPSDRTYRKAWVADVAAGVVSHDMVKAREIHKNFMRAARTPLLAPLDTAYMKADEKGAAGATEKRTIVAQKQTLRDVTTLPEISTAATVEDLKQVWPVALGVNPLVKSAA